MGKFYLQWLVQLAVATGWVATTTDASPNHHKDFHDLIGKWEIQDEILTPEGTFQSGQGAQWHFYEILNGQAVQDDWIAPPFGTELTANQKRQFGTNIRIYNPEQQRWEMAWASSSDRKIDVFTATTSDDRITMTGNFNGAPSRITFFDITANTFSWSLERQSVTEDQWRVVYRMEAKRNPNLIFPTNSPYQETTP